MCYANDAINAYERSRGATLHPRERVLAEVRKERLAQDEKWGEQNHEDLIDQVPGDGGPEARAFYKSWADNIKAELALPEAVPDWAFILLEEAFEAVSEEDPEKIRAELIQVAAVAVSWVEAIDRRKNKESGK